MPAEVRGNMLLWIGCIAGALERDQYIARFDDIGIEPTRVYDIEDARIAPQVEGKFMSAFNRAVSPVTKPACGCAPGCCA